MFEAEKIHYDSVRIFIVGPFDVAGPKLLSPVDRVFWGALHPYMTDVHRDNYMRGYPSSIYKEAPPDLWGQRVDDELATALADAVFEHQQTWQEFRRKDHVIDKSVGMRNWQPVMGAAWWYDEEVAKKDIFIKHRMELKYHTEMT